MKYVSTSAEVHVWKILTQHAADQNSPMLDWERPVYPSCQGELASVHRAERVTSRASTRGIAASSATLVRRARHAMWRALYGTTLRKLGLLLVHLDALYEKNGYFRDLITKCCYIMIIDTMSHYIGREYASMITQGLRSLLFVWYIFSERFHDNLSNIMIPKLNNDSCAKVTSHNVLKTFFILRNNQSF